MDATTAPAERADLPVVVIGAGPVGLAAAAHLSARGMPFLVLEAGSTVGAAVRGWGHIRTFTPWQYLTDPTAEKLLAPTGWTRPATAVPPTGDELADRYLDPLAAVLGDGVRLGHRVLAVSRDGFDRARTLGRDQRPFLLRVRDDAGAVTELRARAVIDASGTWEQPNPIGASGLPVLGEREAADVLVGPLPDVLGRDRARFAGRKTLVVGAGHSAANTLLSLGRLATEEPGTEIVWAIRGASPARVYGGGDADELAARGRLGTDLRGLVASGAVRLVTGFAATQIVRDGSGTGAGATATGEGAAGAVTGTGTVTVVGNTPAGTLRLEGLHAIAAATGFRPDLGMLAELRLDLDPGLESPRALGPLIDPAFHSCGTVPPHGHRELAQPEPGLFVVGMKSYGRAPTFLVTTGNEQVRSVVAALAGDVAAADEVQLVLPETGVCSVDAGGEDTPAPGCCGTSATPPARGFPTGLPGGRTVVALRQLAVSPPA